MTAKKPKLPRPPGPLQDAGKAYWRIVCSEFEVEGHHFDLLYAACVQLDRAASAKAVVDAEGLIAKDRFGQSKPHPAVEIERAAHLAFKSLCRELGLDIEPPESRGQRRPGTGV